MRILHCMPALIASFYVFSALAQESVELADSALPVETASSLSSSITVRPTGPLVADGNSSYAVMIQLRDRFHRPVVGQMVRFKSSIAGDLLAQPKEATDANGETVGLIATTIADATRMLSLASPRLSAVRVNAPFVAGDAAKLSFRVQSRNGKAGRILSTVVIAVEDQFGNVVLSDSTDIIELSIAGSNNSARLEGQTTVQAVSGVAVFNDLRIDTFGMNYRLQAKSKSLAYALGNSFNLRK